MCVQVRQLLLGLSVFLLVAPAQAWVESTVESAVATVELERSGKAVVSHELKVRVRGGPWTGLALAGVDAGSEPLSDGTCESARGGPGADAARPLLLELDESGTLHIEVDDDKGLRGGTYLLRFGYRTDFLQRELIQAVDEGVLVRWVSPRLPDGIDSAKVVFRVPTSDVPPRLPSVERKQVLLGLAEDDAGVFVASVRRAHDKDELEIVRPHVAKGEPVVWRFVADERVFDAFNVPEPALSGPTKTPERPLLRLGVLFGALGALSAYFSLILLKWRYATSAAQLRNARVRPLVPLPIGWRAALSASSLALSVILALEFDRPTLASIALLSAMALSALHGAAAEFRPRGPGSWLPLREKEAFERRAKVLPGAFLDATTMPGSICFCAGLALFALGVALLVSRDAPYDAALLGVASACLWPVFLTGRHAELPPDPAVCPQSLFSHVARKLSRNPSVKVVPWARLPQGQKSPDELRLLVVPREALDGLLSLEIALEYQQSHAGPLASPCAIVRAADGSAAYRALPRNVVWTRGRKPEERVAVIRPDLPMQKSIVVLVRRLIQLLSRPSTRADKMRRKSRGSFSLTSKDGTTAFPLQAT